MCEDYSGAFGAGTMILAEVWRPDTLDAIPDTLDTVRDKPLDFALSGIRYLRMDATPPNLGPGIEWHSWFY